MRIARTIAAAAAAALLAALAAPTAAHADGILPQPFYADSANPLDACVHGITRGTLTWRFPGPLPAVAVDVDGSLVDKPRLAEPSICRDDGYYSYATFTAYSAKGIVDSQVVKADNGAVTFRFTIGSASYDTGIARLVIQVCRNPIRTLPPSYCGAPVTYTPNIIGPA